MPNFFKALRHKLFIKSPAKPLSATITDVPENLTEYILRLQKISKIQNGIILNLTDRIDELEKSHSVRTAAQCDLDTIPEIRKHLSDIEHWRTNLINAIQLNNVEYEKILAKLEDAVSPKNISSILRSNFSSHKAKAKPKRDAFGKFVGRENAI